MRGRFAPKGMTGVEAQLGPGDAAGAAAARREREERAIDLRSDTVTRPSEEMRRAMANAEVGDDVYGEDPTVNRLERRAAEIFARPAALFVPTGTMGNQIALHLHTRPGQEVVCESRAHVFNYEMAMPAAFSGCLIRPVTTPDGVLSWAALAPALSLDAPYHLARTGLLVVENTLNLAGGVVTPPPVTAEICRRAKDLGLPVHLDGARVFNAATALNRAVEELARGFDSVMFCLSKGLGAPVGSMLVGSEEFIHRARIARKMLGGGMRQAGILAAAGLVALEKGPARLAEDHANARFLADGLAALPRVELDPSRVQSNIVIFGTAKTGEPAAKLVEKLAGRNVLAGAAGPDAVRLVTHLDVSRPQCEAALEVLQALLARE
ncbi:MAG: threonine aldolase family protein [Terriglobales bacterium]